MARIEREHEERIGDLEAWNDSQQTQIDYFKDRFDTGALRLRKSVDTMGDLLDSMDKQMGAINEPIIAHLDPETIERVGAGRTFLDPFTPFIHQMSKSFDKEELIGLAADIGINMEVVGGSGLLDMCRRLIAYVRRRKLFEVLMEAIKAERPNIDWDGLRATPEEKTGHE